MDIFVSFHKGENTTLNDNKNYNLREIKRHEYHLKFLLFFFARRNAKHSEDLSVRVAKKNEHG